MTAQNTPTTTTPTTTQPHARKAPKAPVNGVRIKHIRFVTAGLILGSVRDALDAVSAREPVAPAGYDIWFVTAERRFRFDVYENGAHTRTKYLHETRVEAYEELEPAAYQPA